MSGLSHTDAQGLGRENPARCLPETRRMTSAITPLVLTFNEAPNIARTLSRLSWAKDIVVVDSCSTDGTREIAAAHPGVRVFQHAFTTHAEQWNFGLQETGIATEWVLALDADFVLSDELIGELGAMAPDPGWPATGPRSFTVLMAVR